MMDWEVTWTMSECDARTLILELKEIECQHERQVIWKMIMLSGANGEGQESVRHLVGSYDEWCALERLVARKEFVSIEVTDFGPTGSISVGGPDVDFMVRTWNAKTNLPKIVSVTKTRKAKLKERFKELPKPKRETWEAIVDRVSKSQFLLGANSRGWKADIDFMLRPESWVKVIEGKYDDKTVQAAIENGTVEGLRTTGGWK